MIEIEALTKVYGSAEQPAVDEVSLHIPAGSVFTRRRKLPERGRKDVPAEQDC